MNESLLEALIDELRRVNDNAERLLDYLDGNDDDLLPDQDFPEIEYDA